MGSCLGGQQIKPLKILVLGSAGSGKSTLLKQLSFLHTGSYNPLENLVDYRDIAHSNLLAGTQELLRSLKNHDLTLKEENRKHGRYFTEMNEIPTNPEPAFYEKIKTLWTDPAIQLLWQKRATLSMQIKHYDYLVQNIENYQKEDFVPTDQDKLLLRQRTTGVVRVRLLSDKLYWEFIDVGGQKSERVKWDDIFTNEDIRGIVFLSSLDDYGATSIEDSSLNSFEFSKGIFKQLLANEESARLPKVVFLNKLDLLTLHVGTEEGWAHFQKTFPSFTADPNKSRAQCSAQFLEKQFKEVSGENVRIHLGSCLNSDVVSVIYNDMKKIMTEEFLKNSGLD